MEAWLSGPVPDIIPELQPAAHMLLQCRVELANAIQGLSVEQLNARPGGAASIAFHLRHIAGAIDRLLTYACGEMLDDAQRAAIPAEQEPAAASSAELVRLAETAIEQALAVYRDTKREALFEPRGVGAKQLPSSTIGLLYHLAEHAVRHTGQVIATSKIVRTTS